MKNRKIKEKCKLSVHWDYWYGYFNQLPNLVLAMIVFLVGWLVALMISRGVKKVLSKTSWDQKLFASIPIDPKYSPEIVISKVVYYFLLILVLILFFNILQLHFIAQPFIAMVTVVTESIPNIIKAALILLLGWLIASLLKLLVQKGGTTVRLNTLLYNWKLVETEEQALNILNAAGRVVFYLVLLLFLPGVLSSLNISAVSDPISGMISQMLQFIPKLFAAALTFFVGWVIAKIVREIVTNLLKSVGTENITERLHLTKILENTSLSAVIGTLVYVIILIPTVIATLEALELRGISEPAIEMLQVILTMLPNIFIAIVLVLVGVWLGKIVGQVVNRLLERLGINSIFNYLGVTAPKTAESATLSQIFGRIAQIIIVLLFTIEALQVVELQFLVAIFTGIIAYLPFLFSAIAILGIGLYLGQMVHNILSNIVQERLKFVSAIAKYAIIAISIFMALDQLGVAGSIVNSAFVLILGGLALAFGLAFGLGGREYAAEWLKKWQNTSGPDK